MIISRLCLLPITAALALLAPVAGAVPVTSGAPEARAEQSIRHQLERQRKLQVKCARFAAAKAGNVRRSAWFGRMCGAATAPAGNSPVPGDVGYLDEILDVPPIFTPPVDDGTPPEGDAGNLPIPLPTLEALPPASDVPEPGSLALLGLGLAGLGALRRRRR